MFALRGYTSLATSLAVMLGVVLLATPAAAAAKKEASEIGPNNHSCSVSAGRPFQLYPHPSEPFHVAARGSATCGVGVTIKEIRVEIQRWDAGAWSKWHAVTAPNRSSLLISKRHDYVGCASFRNVSSVKATNGSHTETFTRTSSTSNLCA